MDITPEERKILEDNIAKFQNLSKEDLERILLSKQISDNPTSGEDLKKLLDCPHEIVFTVNAHVLTQNEKGETTGTKEIYVKNYHIPVPIDKDYTDYMKTFFHYLETKIIESIKDTNKDSKDKEEN